MWYGAVIKQPSCISHVCIIFARDLRRQPVVLLYKTLLHKSRNAKHSRSGYVTNLSPWSWSYHSVWHVLQLSSYTSWSLHHCMVFADLVMFSPMSIASLVCRLQATCQKLRHIVCSFWTMVHRPRKKLSPYCGRFVACRGISILLLPRKQAEQQLVSLQHRSLCPWMLLRIINKNPAPPPQMKVPLPCQGHRQTEHPAILAKPSNIKARLAG